MNSKIIIRKFNSFIKRPESLLIKIMVGTSRLWSDETYLRIMYFLRIHKFLNLDNPKTFNEKLQWLKLYDRKPEYTMMVDKVKVKDYVASIIGEEHVIPTLGVWERPEDIDFDALPNQFVLKCNHNSGGLFICKDKSKVTPKEWKKVLKGLRKSLQKDYFFLFREWPYKDVPRRILAEKFMTDETQNDGLKDYKFMCFDGKVNCSFVCSDRSNNEGLKVTFFDKEWNKLPFTRHYPASEKVIERPAQLQAMIECAEKLSKDFPFVRTDFYEIDGRYYFGELTFFPGSGMEEFSPEEWDERLGKLITLPNRGGYLIENQAFTLHVYFVYSDNYDGINDYKIFNFNGKPEFIEVDFDRFVNHKRNLYTTNWEFINKEILYKCDPNHQIERPEHLEEMLKFASMLSKDCPYLRTDFYVINNQIYFGELTLYHGAGLEEFRPKEWNEELGKMIELPNRR